MSRRSSGGRGRSGPRGPAGSTPERRARAAERRRARAHDPSAHPVPPLGLAHPATLVAVLVAAAAILFSVTFRIIDSDFWQHLLVGRVMWETGAIPREHLWSWPSYGRPEVLPSWLFRWALWPFYSLGGVEGLFAWRWLTTLLALGFAAAAARRLGARGLTLWVVLAWCALIYRARSQVRPETLAAVLLAAQIWILERARAGGRAGHDGGGEGREPGGRDARGRHGGLGAGWFGGLGGLARLGGLAWLVPITWVWANAHVSYFLAFVLLGIHGVGAWLARRGDLGSRARALRPFLVVGLAMAAVAFANPWGWEQLWQPFDYALNLSREPLFRGIGELQPVTPSTGWRSGVWPMIVGWPLLLLWRWRRHGFDLVEATTCALVTAYALPSQRFLGVYALVAAPYLARDLDAWVRARRWPRWTAAPAARAALASFACVAIGLPEWSRPLLAPGVGIALERFPVSACDFMARHGVRGRGFEHLRFVGYQAWRFWPDRERLPFMDIHQTGTPVDRAAFAATFTDPATWPALAERYRLDYALLDRRQPSGAELLDVVDADSAWALVFADDAAALYVRRATLPAVADSFGFPTLGAGAARLAALPREAAGDPDLRRRLRGELERAVASSPWSARANALLAELDMIEDRAPEARRRLEAALAVDPELAGVHQRLGVVALWEGRPERAIAEFERERRLNPEAPGIELGLGMAYQRAGDAERARFHYRRELERDPGSVVARAALDSLGQAGR